MESMEILIMVMLVVSPFIFFGMGYWKGKMDGRKEVLKILGVPPEYTIDMVSFRKK